jgi:hypothetical protein
VGFGKFFAVAEGLVKPHARGIALRPAPGQIGYDLFRASAKLVIRRWRIRRWRICRWRIRRWRIRRWRIRRWGVRGGHSIEPAWSWKCGFGTSEPSRSLAQRL